MHRPPLHLALRSVLAASVDGASRLGLLATLHPASPAEGAGSARPVPAPATTRSTARGRAREAQAAQAAQGQAAQGQAAPGMATVLTMPRVIPIQRKRRGPESLPENYTPHDLFPEDLDPDPSAA